MAYSVSASVEMGDYDENLVVLVKAGRRRRGAGPDASEEHLQANVLNGPHLATTRPR